ncbi:MAG: low molecular weight phosphotyrosine protein phosphatase [Chitinophagaceae bacterium]|jgi:protein-tyrosine phosphatase|nr:low molecular weight phosphotyrosine protein phosphatase [Chitinophagaceae bacterium]
MRILMVCLGNICRSPLAEGILRKHAEEAGLEWFIDSAGTNGLHDGEPPHRLSQKVAGLNGINISGQRSRRFRRSDMDDFDLILAMAGDVLSDIRDIAGQRFEPSRIRLFMDITRPGEELDVPDPWYGEEPDYHEVFEILNEVCAELVRQQISTTSKLKI